MNMIAVLSLSFGIAVAPARAQGDNPEASGPQDASSQQKASQTAAAPGSLPTEVVIKGEDKSKLGAQKPPLSVEVDQYESIRPSLVPDQSLLLAVSPLTVSWRRTHPDLLENSRVVEPWRTAFSQKPGIAFPVREQFVAMMGRKIDEREVQDYSWSLTVADEDGRVFQHYEGSGNPPEELLWSGQNDQGEWIRAGRSYSAVYAFTDPAGSPHTSVGRPLLYRGIIHQEESGMYLSMDSGVLFGKKKSSPEVVPAGLELLRAAADLVKRRFSGIPISVRVFAATKDLGASQARAISSYLLAELMATAKGVSTDAAGAQFSDQRVEIVLLNR